MLDSLSTNCSVNCCMGGIMSSVYRYKGCISYKKSSLGISNLENYTSECQTAELPGLFMAHPSATFDPANLHTCKRAIDAK